MKNYENLNVSLSEGILLIEINRPKALNALNRKTLEELDDVFNFARESDEIMGVILTGAGDKSFVAGADITEIKKLNTYEGIEFAKFGQGIFRKIETLGKVVVAAINGFALGGGCELAMSCSVRFASENAKLGQPEVKLGLIPGYGGTQRLVRLIGKGRALKLLLTGDMVDAKEAFEVGLVDAVFPHENLIEESKKFLKRVFKNSPLACKLVLDAVNGGEELELDAALQVEANLFGISAGSQDAKEGITAFLEKRSPNFSGK